MKIRQITSALEEFAPLALQDGYDNAGLQIGLAKDAEATGALLCIDVTEDVVDEAVRLGCNLIVSHHPLLFRPLKNITGDDYVGRTAAKAIKSDITVYSAHTNLDSAPGGVNSKMAEKLDLGNLQWLSQKGDMGGEGLVGELREPLSARMFLDHVKELFGLTSMRVNSWAGHDVKRVALCGGSGAFLIPKAVEMGADAFITGEVGYHRFFGHEDNLLLVEIGHYESEQYTVEVLKSVIEKVCPELPVHITAIKTNPINYL